MLERRAEIRTPAEGPVELQAVTAGARRVAGALLDLSERGLRVRHSDPSMGSGTRVRFSHAGGSGTAVVVWTRILFGAVECGLHVESAA